MLAVLRVVCSVDRAPMEEVARPYAPHTLIVAAVVAPAAPPGVKLYRPQPLGLSV